MTARGARQQPHPRSRPATTTATAIATASDNANPDPDARRAALADQARLLHHQGEPHVRSGLRRPAAGQRRSDAGAVRARRQRPITTRWPNSSCCSTTTTARAISRRSATAGSCRRIPSTYVHKYGNARNNQSPMLLGPTDAIYDSAKAHGLTVRAYGERGVNTITPATATWTDMFNDWKNGTHNVTIAAHAVIVGLRDIYHPTYGAAEIGDPRRRARGHLPEGVRAVRAERPAAQPGSPAALQRSHGGHEPRVPHAARAGRGQRPGARPDRRCDLAQPVLEGLGDLRHRGRLAGRPRPRRRPPNGGPGRSARSRGAHAVDSYVLLHHQHVPDHRADPRAAAAEPVRAGGAADVRRVHLEARSHALHRAPQPDPARRDEPGDGRAQGPAARDWPSSR